MAVPMIQAARVGAYVVKQKLAGRRRYPLVLMLEPLFRCNLACSGCGKIDYPDEILNRRLSVAECLQAVDECGAPVVSIPGGEPLLHKEIGEEMAVPSYLIDDADAIQMDWLDGKDSVGITAGASAPEQLVQEVIERLKRSHSVELQVLDGVTERVQFKLPPELLMEAS